MAAEAGLDLQGTQQQQMSSEGLLGAVVRGFIKGLRFKGAVRDLPIGSLVVPFWDCLIGV